MLCVLDIEGDNVSVLEGVPENISPGQVGTVCLMMHGVDIIRLHFYRLLFLFFHTRCLFRHFGLQATQVWCLLAGGTSLSELASSTVPTGGDCCL